MTALITIDANKRMTRAEAEMHEKAIIDNIEDSGQRLLKIKEEHGYEAMGFSSFKDYAKSLSDKMSIGKVWGLVDQAQVNRNLTKELGRPVHLPMTHALALKDLKPEQQLEAFNEAIKGHKKGAEKPSEKVFQRIAAKIAPKTKGAKKATRADDAGWSKEDLAKDAQLTDAFTAIQAVYGADDAMAIQTGTLPMKRADVVTLAKLPKEKMLEIQDLIFANHWSPAECLKFLSKMPEEEDEIKNLFSLCLATRGKFWTGDFRNSAFTITCKANKAAIR